MLLTKLSLNKEMDDTAEPATGSILCKKVFLKILQTPKHLCWCLFLINLQA